MDRFNPRPAIAFAALLGLAACASPMPPPPDLPPSGQCVAAAGAWAIGRAPDAGVVEQVRIDTRSSAVRVVRPGDVVTMDYRVDRVNIKVNERNAIVGVSCG